MNTNITLTETEAQFLRDLLLRQIKLLADAIGDKEAEEYLKSIGKDHAYKIYKKLA